MSYVYVIQPLRSSNGSQATLLTPTPSLTYWVSVYTELLFILTFQTDIWTLTGYLEINMVVQIHLSWHPCVSQTCPCKWQWQQIWVSWSTIETRWTFGPWPDPAWNGTGDLWHLKIQIFPFGPMSDEELFPTDGQMVENTEGQTVSMCCISVLEYVTGTNRNFLEILNDPKDLTHIDCHSGKNHCFFSTFFLYLIVDYNLKPGMRSSILVM